MNLPRLLEQARTSSFRRWLLNAGLRWSIPFNRPHGFRVVPLPEGGIRVEVPFRRANRNHIRAVHACCLATAAELCSGLELMGRLDPMLYRIIMRTLRMDYHWQAKARAFAEFTLDLAGLKEQLQVPLDKDGVVDYTATVKVYDIHGNHLATGLVTWQVKRWKDVRTKV